MKLTIKSDIMTENKIISFSIPPADRESHDNVAKLKKHCKKTGMNFSFLMLKAIKQLNKDLKL